MSVRNNHVMNTAAATAADLRGFLDRLAALSAETGIVIEGDGARIYALRGRRFRKRQPPRRVFLADGLGYDVTGPSPRYFCCPHEADQQ